MDNRLARLVLQEDVCRKDRRMPARLYEVCEEHRRDLEALNKAYGSIVLPDKMSRRLAKA